MSSRRIRVRLRPATLADREFLFSVRALAFRPYVEPIFGWDEPRQREIAAREFTELPFQVVELGGCAIGYLCVTHHEEHDFLEELAVVPHLQGRGVGSTLVRRAMRGAAVRRVPLRLSVLVNNPARRLYERLGFRVTSIEYPRIRMDWSGFERARS